MALPINEDCMNYEVTLTEMLWKIILDTAQNSFVFEFSFIKYYFNYNTFNV